MMRFLRSVGVIARRDFSAILFSRSFLFFLIGPLFPVFVAAMAGGIGANVGGSVEPPRLGVAMNAADTERVMLAHERLSPATNMPVIMSIGDGPPADPRGLLETEGDRMRIAALLSGSLEAPVLTGTDGQLRAWRGPVSIMVENARNGDAALPEVTLDTVAAPPQEATPRARIVTAQLAQVALFMLTMFLATMVLSNLVEEKANKIIEVLAAAVPMDAVFFGKLVAMLGVSFVGLGVWGSIGGIAVLAGVGQIPFLADPAVGWPAFIALSVIYFSMAYLLLGSVFLIVGGLAATVREVQTLSMPVTMMQLMVFFFASYALGSMGQPMEYAAIAFPFSSPFAMLARAAIEPALMPHLLAIAWQAMWVAIIIQFGARIFRRTVMKSGPPQKKRWRIMGRGRTA